MSGGSLKISVANDLRELSGTAARIDLFCKENGQMPQVSFDVYLAIDELVTNTISYPKRWAGYGDAAGGERDAETMKSLPEGVSAYARTATFSARSIPGKLRKSHRTRAGTWAKIVILEGRLCYRILELDVRELELSPGCPGVVEPQVPHEVEAVGDVRFYVEFYR